MVDRALNAADVTNLYSSYTSSFTPRCPGLRRPSLEVFFTVVLWLRLEATDIVIGGFFLACEDFGRMFDLSFPACTFFFFL